MAQQDEFLDTKGLMCPLPVLKARKRLKAMEPGAILAMEATDPASVIDVPHFCAESGYDLVEHSQSGDIHRFRIRRT